MNRYTIWRNGKILGTYAGKNEAEALDACYQDKGYNGPGYASFDEACKAMKLTRDDHRVVKAD